MNYSVRFEKATHNWAAYVPALPGCVATAPSLEEAHRLIAEAVEIEAA